MATAWNNKLEKGLAKAFGKKKGAALARKYLHAFSSNYCDSNTIEHIIGDIEQIEALSDENPIAVNLYRSQDTDDHPLHLRLFQWQSPTPLSDILPVLENLDLRTFDEHPFKIRLDDAKIWVRDFTVAYEDDKIDIEKVKPAFEDAIIQVYYDNLENDGFNRLILDAKLTWRDVIILRAYAKYLQQIHFRFSQAYIENALCNHPALTQLLVALFRAKHDPKSKKSNKQIAAIEKKIVQGIENVSSLDEDRILHMLLALITATLRTNYFVRNNDGSVKNSIAIKLKSELIPELPKPIPMFEIFVYSPRFEAVHLRSARVARGGLRWSDRREDFRTEILGLMKAQKVKNSVIVPSGAKGGFVLKALPANASREEIQAEVISCYQEFIRSMLDITDNIKNKKNIPPKEVICHDDPDPYLVVAADKGTASFSDTANAISDEYDFWLGDAFASGGSEGYDHKKIGITARGAWESVKRHFRELDIDVMRKDITVVGIGDMSGDVFGNGMLYSDHIKLVAAFDHRDIFIDPNPIPAASFKERKRLFKLSRSSWQNYNTKLISKGGGVFSRSLKSINITPEMKKALDITANRLTPSELIRAILCAPVDLLFNGGIGTYVKATTETNADVGDRANDYTRVNGEDLRCKVVGEGGNLGLTQRGRIEYALNDGIISTDFIDNSAGVDCSDHEVNLKVLINAQFQQGKLTAAARKKLLLSLTEEVADLVLHNNHQQALLLSFSAYDAKKNFGLHQNYIKELESQGILKRKLEFIPSDKELLERHSAGDCLTRPEIAVLLAYTKIHTKQEILDSDLPERNFFSETIATAFPQAVRKKYHALMEDHQLYREIIATQLANRVVNQMGMTFLYRMQLQTGAPTAEIIRAYAVSSHIFGTTDLRRLVESLDFKIPMSLQYEMLFHIRNLLNLSVRWFLQSNHLKGKVLDTIKDYSRKIRELERMIPMLMGGRTKEYMDNLIKQFTDAGLSDDIAQRIATYRAIYTALNIIFVSTENDLDLMQAAKVYFLIGDRINLLWFRDQIAHDTREGHWNSLARLSLRDELDYAQRELTLAIIKIDKKEVDADILVDKWMNKNKLAIDRWEKLLAMIHASNSVDYTMFFIAMKELMSLVVNRQ